MKVDTSTYVKGVVCGILAAMCFGFIPVFSKPLMADFGLKTECVLVYRFGFAALMLLVMQVFMRGQLLLPRTQLPSMLLCALCYSGSGGFLVLGYEYMTGGITGVIHYTYPIFTVIIMATLFKEKVKLRVLGAIMLAMFGMYCLGVLGGNASFLPGANRLLGIIIVTLSGACCAGYYVSVHKGSCCNLPSMTLTFWLLFFSTIVFVIISIANGTLRPITSAPMFWNFMGLSFIATVMSNFLLVYAIKLIGSTLSSVIGAVEALTAVVLCAIFFNEPITPPIVAGIVIVITAVSIIVQRPKE